jgi:hypothetical protein
MLDMAPQTAECEASASEAARSKESRVRTHPLAYGVAIVLGVPLGGIAGMIVGVYAGIIEFMLC